MSTSIRKPIVLQIPCLRQEDFRVGAEATANVIVEMWAKEGVRKPRLEFAHGKARLFNEVGSHVVLVPEIIQLAPTELTQQECQSNEEFRMAAAMK